MDAARKRCHHLIFWILTILSLKNIATAEGVSVSELEMIAEQERRRSTKMISRIHKK
jgi:hypothetical protein